MREENIAHEAYKIYKQTGCDDSVKNWLEATDRLRLFPQKVKQAVLSTPYRSGSGSFGLEYIGQLGKLTHYWTSCRESFESYWYYVWLAFVDPKALAATASKLKEVGFFFVAEQPINVAKFIREIELEKLKIVELTKFYRTTISESHVWIEPSSFWTAHSIRMSLLTVLLRAGRNFNRNLEEALNSYNYSRETKEAILRFLDGNHAFKGSHNPTTQRNWHYWFAKRSTHEINGLLT